MMKKTKELVDNYLKTEQLLLNELKILKNWGTDCDCEERYELSLIHHGNFDEIFTYCLECGGMIG